MVRLVLPWKEKCDRIEVGVFVYKGGFGSPYFIWRIISHAYC